MIIIEAINQKDKSAIRLSEVESALPSLKFWAWTLCIGAGLGWIVEFGTGIMIWRLKEAPTLPSIFLAMFLTMITIAMEWAFHEIKKLDWIIRGLSVLALVGYGAFLLDAFQHLDLIPGTLGKGITANITSDVKNWINTINILLLYVIFPSIYLLIGYSLASLFRTFKIKFREYHSARLRVPRWRAALQKFANNIMQLEDYSLTVQESVMKKDEFIRRVIRKYKRLFARPVSFPRADDAQMLLGALLEKVSSKKQAISNFSTKRILVRRLKLYLVIAFMLSLAISYVWIESGIGLGALSDNRIVALLILAGISLVVDSAGVLLFATCFRPMRAFFKNRIRSLLMLNRETFASVAVGVLVLICFFATTAQAKTIISLFDVSDSIAECSDTFEKNVRIIDKLVYRSHNKLYTIVDQALPRKRSGRKNISSQLGQKLTSKWQREEEAFNTNVNPTYFRGTSTKERAMGLGGRLSHWTAVSGPTGFSLYSYPPVITWKSKPRTSKASYT